MSETPQDVIRIGTGTPQGLTRRDFLKIAAVAAGGLTVAQLAACAPRPELAPIYTEGPKNLDTIPEWVQSGIGKITITQNDFNTSGSNVEPIVQTGASQVFVETDAYLVLLTDKSVGKGMYWKSVNIDYPFGKTVKNISIDATEGEDPNKPLRSDHWNIEKASKGSEGNPRYIVIKKPEGAKNQNMWITNPEYLLKTYPGAPKKGDAFMGVGFPEGLNGQCIGQELVFDGTETIERDGISGEYYRFKGDSVPGMVGGAVLSKDGAIVSIISNPLKRQGFTYGMKYAENVPMKKILEIIGAKS